MLPKLEQWSDYAPLRHQVAPFAAAMGELQVRHALGPLEPAGTGTHVVWWNERLVVKLFLPLYPLDGPREGAVARRLQGRLPVATPRVLHEGTLEGWHYLVLERLPGVPWRHAAPSPALARQLGELTQAMRAVPIGGLESLGEPWAAFVADQEASWLARQRSYGTPETLLAQLEPLVARTAGSRRQQGPPTLLHADLHWDHVLVQDDRVTGIFDFGDARLGHADYEHAAVICFVTHRRPELLAAYLDGAGLDRANPTLADRLISWAALHRYGNLAWMADQVWGEPRVVDLPGLRAAITPGL